ncbi:Uncharacterised protein [uncultured archaeon]|nr:Uncharacterised protein [uncultured archaeon]
MVIQPFGSRLRGLGQPALSAEKVLTRVGKGKGYLCGACERDVKNGIAAFAKGLEQPND